MTCGAAYSQIYSTRIFRPDVRTLTMEAVSADYGERVSIDPVRPYLSMVDGRIGPEGDANGHVLMIGLDVMDHNPHNLTYTLIHLDKTGKADDLLSSEYLEGFTTADITDQEQSFNTSELYTHYRFTVPNADMQIRLSGRYAIIIYEDNDRDRIVAIQCFEVVEPTIEINARARANTDIEINGRYQQVDVELADLTGTNVKNDYSLVVRQNGRTDNEVIAPAPTYVLANGLRWQQCRDLIFEAGTEYHRLDIFSRFIAGTGVDRIVYTDGEYHAILYADEAKPERPYRHEFDANGQMIVHAERVTDPDTEAEYMWTHWVLLRQEPWLDGQVYVGGDWNQNRIDQRSRMQYDFENRCYYLDMPLKQGGYDYQYWLLPEGKSRATLLPTEGGHWETRNEYTIYVYYRPFGGRYDQLVGIRRIESQENF